MFDPDTIERYITSKEASLSDAAARTYRPNLRRVARAVAPTLQPPSPTKQRRARSKLPYSDIEVEGLIRLADNQRTQTRCRRLLTLLCLGLGAGLQPGEYQDLRDEDVFCRDRVVYVAVGGRRVRVIPVLEPYGKSLLKLSVVIPDAYLLGGAEHGDRRNSVHNVLNNVVGAGSLPVIELGRLRATWMTHHIQHLGLDAFLAGAGIDNSYAIFDLVAFLPPAAPSRVASFLKGKA
ncbi:MAG: site-specific integrase [Acidimicrobiia bacterium]